MKYVPAATGVVYAGGKAVAPYAPIVIDALGNVVSGTKKVIKTIRNRKAGKKVVGAGSTSVVAPVAVTKQVRGYKPKFRQSKGAVHVTHRELVTTVVNTTGSFRVNNNASSAAGFYRINPSNSNLFSWLPTIGANFDSYRFTTVKFCYVPLCATTEVGRVALVWDKDSQDPLPVDRASISSYHHSVETPPWGEVVLNVPVDKLLRFVTDSNTSDRKLVDFGQFLFATYAGTTTNQIGDIYVEYGIEFVEAQPAGTLTQMGDKTVGGGLVGSGPSYLKDADININSTTCNIEFFSAGTYLITAVVNGGTINTPSFAGGNGTQIGALPVGGTTGTSIYSVVFSTTGVSTGTPTITQTGLALTRVRFQVTRVTSANAYLT